MALSQEDRQEIAELIRQSQQPVQAQQPTYFQAQSACGVGTALGMVNEIIPTMLVLSVVKSLSDF